MSADGQGTKWRRNIAENFNRLSRVHQRYRQTTDRQTDRRRHIANMNLSSRSLKMNANVDGSLSILCLEPLACGENWVDGTSYGVWKIFAQLVQCKHQCRLRCNSHYEKHMVTVLVLSAINSKWIVTKHMQFTIFTLTKLRSDQQLEYKAEWMNEINVTGMWTNKGTGKIYHWLELAKRWTHHEFWHCDWQPLHVLTVHTHHISDATTPEIWSESRSSPPSNQDSFQWQRK